MDFRMSPRVVGCDLYGNGNGTYNENRFVTIRFQTQEDPFWFKTVLKLTSLHSSDHSGSKLVWCHSNKVTVDDLKNHIRKLCGFELGTVGMVDGYGNQIAFSDKANLLVCIKDCILLQQNAGNGIYNNNSNNNNNNNNNKNKNNYKNNMDNNHLTPLTPLNYDTDQNEDFHEFDDPITNVFRVAHSRTVSKQMEDKLDLAKAFDSRDMMSDSDSENKTNRNNFSNNNSPNKDGFDYTHDGHNSDINDDNWEHLHSSDSENDDNKSLEYSNTSRTNNSVNTPVNDSSHNNNNNNNYNNVESINALKIKTKVSDNTLKSVKKKKFEDILSPAVVQDIARNSFNAELTDEMADELALQKLENQMQKERDGDDGTIVQSTPLVHSKLIENLDELDDNWSDFDDDDEEPSQSRGDL